MTILQAIITMSVTLVVSYSFVRVAFDLDSCKKVTSEMHLLILVFTCLVSIIFIIHLLKENDRLRDRASFKCPEYKRVENIYIIKPSRNE